MHAYNLSIGEVMQIYQEFEASWVDYMSLSLKK